LADGPTPDERAQLNQVAIASGLGCSIVATLVLTIGGGVLLDRALDTEPVLTLCGVALGLFTALYQLYELAMVGQPGRKTPPISRGLARLPGGRGRSSKRVDGVAGREAGDSSASGSDRPT
jgi:ATP synthase protein I